MKKLLKQYRILLVSLLLPYLFIMASAWIKVPYDVTVPATTNSVGNVITISNGNSIMGDIQTVSVFAYSRVSLLSYLLGLINPYATIERTYDYYDNSTAAIFTSGSIQKRVSIYNALIAGYEAANSPIEYRFKGNIVHTLATYAPDQLELGDIIIEWEGKKITEEYDVSDAIKDTVSYGKEYSAKILRNNQEILITLKPKAHGEDIEGNRKDMFGLAVYEYYVPQSADPKYSIGASDSIGPSGGLMQSLYIYELLTGGKLTKGLNIVGTGTVDAKGKAGPIGGIYQKIITAHFSKADIFFVPVTSNTAKEYEKEANYQEALASYQNLGHTNMQFVPVSSLEDIILYLKGYVNGGNS